MLHRATELVEPVKNPSDLPHGFDLTHPQLGPAMMAAFEATTTAHRDALARQKPRSFGYVYQESTTFRRRLRDTLAVSQFIPEGETT